MRDKIEAVYGELVFLKGFDKAIIGVREACIYDVVVYSRVKCLDILINDHKMDYMEAVEFFDLIVAESFEWEKTPIIVNDGFEPCY